ncbi:hypothetical protein [Nocardia sp. NPDC057272]|uniref:hypothetical protein n=1 Tax=Nocardia sp. NPDC057272 TaxID=3346079 RepID=UPI00362DA5FF
MTTSTRTNAELAQAWLDALDNVDNFAPLCAPGAQVWHSNDNIWISFEKAIENVHTVGGLPTMTNRRFTVTDTGFLVQFSGEINGQKIHNTIIVKTEDGFATHAEEYIGLELDPTVLGTVSNA